MPNERLDLSDDLFAAIQRYEPDSELDDMYANLRLENEHMR
jgi:hypothetical protein